MTVHLDLPPTDERMFTFTVGSGGIAATGDDQVLMSIPDPRVLGAWPFSVGAGVMPPIGTPFKIVGGWLQHGISPPPSGQGDVYLLIGNTQPNGDIWTPRVANGQALPPFFFPHGRYLWFPNDGGGNGGAEMHVHGKAPSGSTHWFNATIFYALGGDGPPGALIRLAWDGINAPMDQDWIGLYSVVAADTAYLDWRYVSGSHVPVLAAAVGAMLFPLPNTPGDYEFRLFTNGSYNRLATSGPVVVQ
jgi:hypothetical protein